MFKRPIAPGLVSVLVVLMFGAVVGLMLLHPTTMDQTTFTVLNVMLGTLAAGFGTVIQYWLGSSSSSKSKDDTLAALSGKKDDTSS